MIKVVVPKNSGVQVQLEGADGSFHISFGKAAVKVYAELPVSKGRKGVIYEERYAGAIAGADVESDKIQVPGGTAAVASVVNSAPTTPGAVPQNQTDISHQKPAGA
jgi:hypothetical protein